MKTTELVKNEKQKSEESIMKEEKNNNGLTEIVFILDRSGSMSGYEADVIGGFNATIEKQRKETGTALVSVVLFDNLTNVVYDRVNIDNVKPMTATDFRVGGCTALLDAIGGAIRHIGNIHKYARKEDIPEHTIFLITTDGEENASHLYSSRRVKEMIKHQREKYGWEFIFVASNIDAVETADRYGILKERAVRCAQSPEGIQDGYVCFSEAISCVRNKKSLDDGKWKN